MASDLRFCSSPNGIRTRVATLRGWCPRPLDDGALIGAGTLLRWLGGEDSNPQRQDQNLLCYRLHHPRTGRTSLAHARDFTTSSILAWRRKPTIRPTATATVSRAM